jgi:hypothetical protein
MGNKDDKAMLFLACELDDGINNAAPALQPWEEEDEAGLKALIEKPIDMQDTAYGRFEAQKKKDLELAYGKMTAAERAALRSKMDQIDEDGGIQIDTTI